MEKIKLSDNIRQSIRSSADGGFIALAPTFPQTGTIPKTAIIPLEKFPQVFARMFEQ
ncbi:MAG: hypothetical protein AAFZ15_08620 [Bacteroidota bacterium]